MAFLGLYTGMIVTIIIMASCCSELVLTALTYMSVDAIAIGVSKDFSFYIIAITNAASTFGRVSAGLIGDKVGMPFDAMDQWKTSEI
jgi:hypothetical protein